jgi:hypothetical protein
LHYCSLTIAIAAAAAIITITITITIIFIIGRVTHHSWLEKSLYDFRRCGRE